MSKTDGSARHAYARAFAAQLLQDTDKATALPEFLLETIFRALSREQEMQDPRRDEFGNWQAAFDETYADGRYQRPWLDALIFETAGVDPATLPPRWPGGKRWALCLTHDVDSVTQYAAWSKVYRPLTMALRAGAGAVDVAKEALYLPARAVLRLRHAGCDPLWRFDEWLDIEARHGFRSSWLFVPYARDYPTIHDPVYDFGDEICFAGKRMRVKDMMREVSRAGHEVGLHGSFQSATRPGVLAAQKRSIEDIVQCPVISTRQHYLRYDVGRTPRLQADAGLRVDSTQGWNRTIGFRAGTCFPYPVWDFAQHAPLPLLQAPMHVMDVSLHRPAYLGLDAGAAVRAIEGLIRHVKRYGGMLTLNWHPHSIAEAMYRESYEGALTLAKSHDPACVLMADIPAIFA